MNLGSYTVSPFFAVLNFGFFQFSDQSFSVLDGGVEENGPVAKAITGKCEWQYSDIDCVRVRRSFREVLLRFLL